jgi:hypothetical protein
LTRTDAEDSMSEAYLEGLFPKLGFIVMQRADSGELVLLTPAPGWFADAAKTAAAAGPATLGNTLPFLDHVRTEADRYWWSGQEGVQSGELFTVPGEADEHLVRPRFVTLAGRKLLLLERLTGAADSRPVLQAAREARLVYERAALAAKDARAAVDTIAQLASHLLEGELPPTARDTARGVARAASVATAALDQVVGPPRAEG